MHVYLNFNFLKVTIRSSIVGMFRCVSRQWWAVPVMGSSDSICCTGQSLSIRWLCASLVDRPS